MRTGDERREILKLTSSKRSDVVVAQSKEVIQVLDLLTLVEDEVNIEGVEHPDQARHPEPSFALVVRASRDWQSSLARSMAGF